MIKSGLAEVYRGKPPRGFDTAPYRQAEEEARDLGIVSKPEDVITYIFYPKVAKEFLSRR